VLALIAILLALLAAEVSVRVVSRFDPRTRVLASPHGARHHVPTSAAEFMESRPDALVSHGNSFGYRRNRFGFNDREPEEDSRPGAFRVVGLGDSFAFGMVPYPRSYLTTAEAVATLYTRADPPVVIRNLGLPAAGLADYRLVYRFFGRDPAPDLALVTVYLGNDLLDFRGSGPVLEEDGHGLRSWFLTFVGRVWSVLTESGAMPTTTDPVVGEVRGGQRIAAVLDLADDGSAFGRKRMSDEAWVGVVRAELASLVIGEDEARRARGFLAGLERLRAELAADGVPIALVFAPSRLQIEDSELDAALARDGLLRADVDRDLPARRILTWAEANGVPVLDLTAIFRERSGGRAGLYVPNDTHWNVSGNDLAGLEVGRWLAGEVRTRESP